MSKINETYHKLLNDILENGFKYEDPNRKGVNRIQIPTFTFNHDFKDGFPAITTKNLYWKGIVGELLWFLRGDTNIKYLVNNGINIWNKDAYNYYLKEHLPENGTATFEEFIHLIKQDENPVYHELGDLGRIYGAQWRNWHGKHLFGDAGHALAISQHDQICNLIKGLKENPMGTKHIVTAWNPAELDDMALPPCHWSFEILVEPLKFWDRVNIMYQPNAISTSGNLTLVEESLNESNIPKYQFTLKWHQRSCDSFLGIPFNIASYALLAHIIGKMTNMIPKGIIGDLSNVHIYEPHLDAVKEQLSRDVNKYGKCELDTNKIRVMKMGMHNNIDNWLHAHDIDDFKLINYKSYPSIPAEMLAYNK